MLNVDSPLPLWQDPGSSQMTVGQGRGYQSLVMLLCFVFPFIFPCPTPGTLPKPLCNSLLFIHPAVPSGRSNSLPGTSRDAINGEQHRDLCSSCWRPKRVQRNEKALSYDHPAIRKFQPQPRRGTEHRFAGPKAQQW